MILKIDGNYKHWFQNQFFHFAFWGNSRKYGLMLCTHLTWSIVFLALSFLAITWFYLRSKNLRHVSLCKLGKSLLLNEMEIRQTLPVRGNRIAQFASFASPTTNTCLYTSLQCLCNILTQIMKCWCEHSIRICAKEHFMLSARCEPAMSTWAPQLNVKHLP